MSTIELKTIGVIGAGTMGSGIAEVAAAAGFQVKLCDSDPRQLDRGLERIRGSLDKAARRGKCTESLAAISNRIACACELSSMAPCDFVIEAVVESADVKRRVHAELGTILRPNVRLASNTSSISITDLGAASGRPELFVGMHFFNPVPVMSLVEVVRGRATDDATVAATEDLARRMGKTPVRVNDAPGFVANRVLMPMINEAIYALADGVADAASIDQVMVLGCNHPMGPLALADLIGLDVCLFIMEVLERDTGDVKFRPCPLLRELVSGGRLGRKTKRGFYEYP